MEAFISGHSVVTPSGTFAVNQNPRRPSDESSSNSNSRSNNNNRNGNGSGGESVGNGGVLAERTNQLMSSYCDFISGQEDEEMLVQRVYGDGSGNHDGGGHSSSTIRRGNNTHNNEQHGGYSDSNTNLYTGAPLLRVWGNNNTTSRCELNMKEGLDYDDWDNGSLDSWEKKHRYTHPIYHSKKFKKFVLAVLVAGAIVGTVGVIAKSSRNSKGGDTNNESGGNSGDVMNVDKLASEGGDWNAEMKEAILQEEEDKEARLESGVEKAASASTANALNAQTIGIAANNDVNMDRPPEVEEDNEEEDKQGGDEDAATAVAANAIPSFTIQEEEKGEPKNDNKNDTSEEFSQAPDTPTTNNQQQVEGSFLEHPDG